MVRESGEIIGLLYAGNGQVTYACPILAVLAAMNCHELFTGISSESLRHGKRYGLNASVSLKAVADPVVVSRRR